MSRCLRMLGALAGAFMVSLMLGWQPGATLREAGAQAARPRGHRVVIELTVSGEERWSGILNNVDNLMKAFADQGAKVAVIAHADGLGLLLTGDPKLQQRMRDQHARGFPACENTMRRKKITW